MRGIVDTNKTIACYLVGRTLSGSSPTFYIYYDPLTTSGAGQALFASLPYTASTKPHQVYINSTSPGVYSLRSRQSTSTSVTGMINTNWAINSTVYTDVLEISSVVEAGAPLTLTPNSAVDERFVYTGVWYTVRFQSGNLARFKCQGLQNPTSSSPFKNAASTYNISPTDFQVMFIPQDAGSAGYLGIWDYNTSTSSWGCWTSSDLTLSLKLWTSWVQGDQVNGPSGCNNVGWASPSSRRCPFASVNDCNQQYLYSYCQGSEGCGSCMGVCAVDPSTGTAPACSHDYDPELQRNGLSPLSCYPRYTSPPTVVEEYTWLVIIAVIVFFFVIISFFVLIVYLLRSSQK